MRLDENFKRRVRIIGTPGDVSGHGVKVQDAETGEDIEQVFRAVVVVIDATEITLAELSYYDSDDDGNPVTKKITVQDPEFDVTAMEI